MFLFDEIMLLAKICLKVCYFFEKLQKSPSTGDSAPKLLASGSPDSDGYAKKTHYELLVSGYAT